MKVRDKLTMVELYSKLSKLGFSKDFIRAIGLPSWWVDELDQSTSVGVMYEAAGYISKRLFIDLGSLIKVSRVPKFIENLTYEEIIDILRNSKLRIVESRLLELKEEFLLDSDMSLYECGELDYYEQLVILDI